MKDNADIQTYIKKQVNDHEQKFQELWNTNRLNLQMYRVEEAEQYKNLFNETVAENFPIPDKELNTLTLKKKSHIDMAKELSTCDLSHKVKTTGEEIYSGVKWRCLWTRDTDSKYPSFHIPMWLQFYEILE